MLKTKRMESKLVGLTPISVFVAVFGIGLSYGMCSWPHDV